MPDRLKTFFTRSAAVSLITFYQRYISPYKGFRCAHAVLHKGDSCSQAIKGIIEEDGVLQGYRRIRQRLDDCTLAYEKLSKERKEKREKDRWFDSCDCATCNCDVLNLLPKKSCDIPDVPCDCSL